MAVIYAFGDSITYGAWDIGKSGWAARLRQYLDDFQTRHPEEYYGLFYNLGIPGEDTSGLVKRFAAETDAREREGEDAMFIFAYGANDAAFLAGKNIFRIPKETFKVNLEHVLAKASEISNKIAIVNILPVMESLNSKPRNGKIRLNGYMEEYNTVLAEVAEKYKAKLVDVYSLFMKAGHEELFSLADGLHPNDKGHEIMFNAIKLVVEEMIGWKE